MRKRVVAAFLMCAVMVLVAAVPLVGADTHHVVKSSQGPRGSAVSWDYAPTEGGVWTGHVLNSGLKSLVVDVNDITTGAASSVLHQRIRFAVAGDDMTTSGAIMAKNHKYNITVTPNGPKGTSCTVDDVFTSVPPPVALFTYSITGATVVVDGSASYDPNPGASITGWGWEWGDGTTGTGVTASHRYTAANAYTITLTMLSNTGMTSSMSNDVLLVDNPPVPAFTTTVMSLNVSVDASASTDDFGIVSYDWNWGDGSTGTGVTATHTYAASGTYEITLIVTDTIGHTYSVSRTVRFGGGMPPVMAFTYTVSGYTVTVDASSSIDDIGIVSYAWDWGDGTNGTGMMATHAYTATGPYIVTLTVTDTIGQTSSMSRHFPGASCLPPIAAFIVTSAANAATVTVDASASTSSVGITSYSWNWGDYVTGPSGVTSSHKYMATLDWTITLTVTDALGQKGTVSKIVHVVRTAIPPLPYYVVGTIYASDGVTPLAGCTVTITGARAGTTLIGMVTDDTGFYAGDISPLYQLVGDTLIVNVIGPAGQTGSGTGVIGGTPYLVIDVTLSAMDMPAVAAFALTASDVTVDFDASASTDDHGIVSYVWDFGDGTTGTGMIVTHTYTIPPLTYNVTLTGIDTDSQTGTAIREFSALQPNNPPVASFSWTASALNVTFNASSSSDSDGTIVSYSWNFGDGNTGTGVTTNHAYAASGAYVVVLTVRDDDGATDTQSQLVTLSPGSVVTLFSDNFDDGSIADWTLTTSGGPITVDTSTGMAAAPSMMLYKQQRAGSTLATHSFAAVTTGHVSAEANLRVDATATGSWKWTYFNLYNASGGVQTYFGFIDGQMSYYTTTLGWQPIGVAYIANTWYNIKLDANLVAGTYDIYVNGAMMMAGAPLWGSGPHSVSSIGFQAGTYNDLFGMTMWVDGVIVSSFA